jgi:hypothetical protein
MFASPEKPAPGLDAAEASLGSNRSRANGFGLAGSAFFREFRHGTDMTRPVAGDTLRQREALFNPSRCSDLRVNEYTA